MHPGISAWAGRVNSQQATLLALFLSLGPCYASGTALRFAR
jgi:hypothetical protein